jgi:hypothetical protein
MIKNVITAAAFEAIKATLPLGSVATRPNRTSGASDTSGSKRGGAHRPLKTEFRLDRPTKRS